MAPTNLFLSALSGVFANKLRAVLTMLGVIIGVASVIAMLALGNGARAAVEARFRFLGSDQIQISPKMAMDNEGLVPAGKILSYEDGLRLPEEVPLVDRVDMNVGGQAKLRFERSTLDINATGVTGAALEQLASSGRYQPAALAAASAAGEGPAGSLDAQDFLSQGRFFTSSEVLEGAEVCVLGSETAEELFAGDDPLGQTVWVNRQRCQVIGVLAELESTDENTRFADKPNLTFYLPISVAIRMLYEDEPSIDMTAHVTDEQRIDEAKAQVAAYLRQRHAIEPDAAGKYEDDFDLTTRKDVLGAQQEAARTFSLLLAAMAAVSLGVGGIGIMNVMLVSVTERTREIGVRMAIGARPVDIVAQFLCEAVLISIAGGLLGVVAGILSVPLAAALNEGNALLAPDSIPLALGVALLTGILFGLYPALRAARMDPIEALRYE